MAIVSDLRLLKYAAISASSAGDNTVLAVVTGKALYVVSLFVVASGTVGVRWESGAGGTALTGVVDLVANTGYVLPYNENGWFRTARGTLLNLELSAGIQVSGSLTYVEVDE